jgi:hypothetical protein
MRLAHPGRDGEVAQCNTLPRNRPLWMLPNAHLVVNSVSVKKANSAPRPAKMGNIASPWRYDGMRHRAIGSTIARRSALLCYARNPATTSLKRRLMPRFTCKVAG